jgi:hypothetical protein
LPPLPAVDIYQIAQNTKTTIGRPRPLAAIGGDNGTPFYIKFPGMPPGLQWVFPFTYGFLYPMPAIGVAPVLVDSSLFPARAQAPPLDPSLALLAAWGVGSAPPAFSPGTRIDVGTSQTIAFPRAIYQVASYNFQVPRSGAKGIIVYLHAFSGAGTVSVAIQDLDPAAGIPAANMTEVTSPAITAPGDSRIRTYPGLTASASVANDVMGGAPYLTAVVLGSQMEFSVGYVAVP